jgi:hypothetical protein
MADADRFGIIATIGQDLITTQLTMATQTPSRYSNISADDLKKSRLASAHFVSLSLAVASA